MTLVLVLLAYALVLGVAGPALLRRARWVDRAPRLGIAAWQAVSASVLIAAVSAGLAASISTVTVSGGLAHLLEACVVALRAQYATPGGAAVGAAGAALAFAVTARAMYCSVAALVRAARGRRAHQEGLALLGHSDPELGALVVDHDAAVVYCLPGRERRIVVTTGALSALEDPQLRAVLAHEHAHLRGRHHLVHAGAEALARAFPLVPIFRHAAEEIARLVELLADDAAGRVSDRLSVAEALVAVAGGAAPAPALAAGGTGAVTRVHRLLAPQRPLGRLRTTLGFAAVAGILATPLAAMAQPAVATVGTACCVAHHPVTGAEAPPPGTSAGRARACGDASTPVSGWPCTPQADYTCEHLGELPDACR